MTNPPPPLSPLFDQSVRDSQTEISQILDEPSSTTSIWDWDNLLDFAVDDHLKFQWNPEDQTVDELSIIAEPSDHGSDGSDRTRKQDPRLTCENFLAGRIPCSCPELDDEEQGVGKKRTRTVTVRSATCQVPGCEADISKLKGYHKQHRVCLICANANSVVIDEQHKRYCQQCGKLAVQHLKSRKNILNA